MDSIKLSFGTVAYKKPIIYIEYKENVTLTAKEINEMVKACITLCGNEPFLVTSDMTSFVNMTPEASGVMKEKMGALNIIASAPIVRRLGQRMLANAFMEINKPPYPMRVFTDKVKAVKWLMEQL